MPVLPWVAIAVAGTEGPPDPLLEEAVGTRRKPFTLVKFRRYERPAGTKARHLTDEQRMNRIGRFRRATNLDCVCQAKTGSP